jgi:hypothetical protein
MPLVVSHNVPWYDIPHVSFIDIYRRYMSSLDEFPQPRGGEWVVFVVKGGHASPLT